MQYLNYLSFILFLLNAFSCNAKSVGFAIVVFILLPFFLLVQFFARSVKSFYHLIPRKHVTKIGPIWTLEVLKKLLVNTVP